MSREESAKITAAVEKLRDRFIPESKPWNLFQGILDNFKDGIDQKDRHAMEKVAGAFDENSEVARDLRQLLTLI